MTNEPRLVLIGSWSISDSHASVISSTLGAKILGESPDVRSAAKIGCKPVETAPGSGKFKADGTGLTVVLGPDSSDSMKRDASKLVGVGARVLLLEQPYSSGKSEEDVAHWIQNNGVWPKQAPPSTEDLLDELFGDFDEEEDEEPVTPPPVVEKEPVRVANSTPNIFDSQNEPQTRREARENPKETWREILDSPLAEETEEPAEPKESRFDAWAESEPEPEPAPEPEPERKQASPKAPNPFGAFHRDSEPQVPVSQQPAPVQQVPVERAHEPQPVREVSNPFGSFQRESPREEVVAPQPTQQRAPAGNPFGSFERAPEPEPNILPEPVREPIPVEPAPVRQPLEALSRSDDPIESFLQAPEPSANFVNSLTPEQQVSQQKSKEILSMTGVRTVTNRPSMGASRGKFYVVSGANGGVGKTTICWHSANIHAKVNKDMAKITGERQPNVWLVETDYSNPKLSNRLGISPGRDSGLVSQALERMQAATGTKGGVMLQIGNERLTPTEFRDRAIMQSATEMPSGLRVIPAPYDTTDRTPRTIGMAINVIIRYLRERGDTVYVDAPTVSSSDDVLNSHLMAEADQVILVGNPGDNLDDTHRAAQAINKERQRGGIGVHRNRLHIFMNKTSGTEFKEINDERLLHEYTARGFLENIPQWTHKWAGDHDTAAPEAWAHSRNNIAYFITQIDHLPEMEVWLRDTVSKQPARRPGFFRRRRK